MFDILPPELLIKIITILSDDKFAFAIFGLTNKLNNGAVLKYRTDNHINMRIDYWLYYYAATKGYLELFNWALSRGYEQHPNICVAAAEGGCLEILQTARKNGSEWGYDVLETASHMNHTHIVKWAIKNGCKWNYQSDLSDDMYNTVRINRYTAATYLKKRIINGYKRWIPERSNFMKSDFDRMIRHKEKRPVLKHNRRHNY